MIPGYHEAEANQVVHLSLRMESHSEDSGECFRETAQSRKQDDAITLLVKHFREESAGVPYKVIVGDEARHLKIVSGLLYHALEEQHYVEQQGVRDASNAQLALQFQGLSEPISCAVYHENGERTGKCWPCKSF